MIWVLATVLVCMVVVLANLLLVYQKRAARLRIAQNPVRKQIDKVQAKLTEIGEEVRTTADKSLAQLREDLGEYQRRSGHAANLTAELDGEAQAWAAEREEEAAALSRADDEEEEKDDDTDPVVDEIIGGRHDQHMKVDADRVTPVDLVRDIRHDLEETYEYIESLRTDALVVQQTAERLGPGSKSATNGAH